MAIPAFVLLALITGAGYAYSTGFVQTTLSPPFLFSYVLTIIMENHGLNDTYGSHCLGNCTYITELSNQYGLALRYSSVAHTSLPNYLTLTSGGNYDRVPFNRDCYPENLTTGCYISGLNIVDSIESSGLSWKAYMEDHTSGGCARSNNPVTYENSHNPFLYYTNIYSNATRCAKIVDANPGANGFLALPTQLILDLNSTVSASNYMWLTPNLCDDGHNRCPPLNNTVSQSNLYLSMLVPKILNSTIFKTQNAALFITWDESSTTANNFVTAIWTGPAAKTNYRSTTSYTQYSGIKTIEIAWNLPSLYPEDANAAAMSEFFISTQFGTGFGGGRPATPM